MLFVATLRVVDPEVFTELGLNEAVAPEGSPATVKPTVPVKPLSGATVAAYVVLPPGSTVREPGVAETPKSDTVTVRVAAGTRSSVVVGDREGRDKRARSGIDDVPRCGHRARSGHPTRERPGVRVILPSGLVPDPAYDTAPPGLTVRLEDGLVIVATGG